MILEPGELEETLADRSLYCIKGKCFICGVKIPKSWAHFQQHGNSCTTCSGRAAKRIEPSLARRMDKEKADRLLEERREGVRSGTILH